MFGITFSASPLSKMHYTPAMPESEHVEACTPGTHLTSSPYRGPRYCIFCEHNVNRDDVALPAADCPDHCFERFVHEDAD